MKYPPHYRLAHTCDFCSESATCTQLITANALSLIFICGPCLIEAHSSLCLSRLKTQNESIGVSESPRAPEG